MLKKPDWTKEFSRSLVKNAPVIDITRDGGRAVAIQDGVYYSRESTRDVRWYRNLHLFMEIGMGSYRLPIIHLLETVGFHVRDLERGPYCFNCYWFGSYDDSAKSDLLRVFPKKKPTREIGPYHKMPVLTDSICNVAGNEPFTGYAWLPRCNRITPEDLVIIITTGNIKLDVHWKGIYGKYRRHFFWFFPAGDDLKFKNGKEFEPEFVDVDAQTVN